MGGTGDIPAVDGAASEGANTRERGEGGKGGRGGGRGGGNYKGKGRQQREQEA